MLFDIQLTSGSQTMTRSACRYDEHGEQHFSVEDSQQAVDFRVVVVSGNLFLTMDKVAGEPVVARWKCRLDDVREEWHDLHRMWNHSRQPWSCAIRAHPG